MDDWDRLAAGLRPQRKTLAPVARRFLASRRDHALGLAPTRLLEPRRAEEWLLFWCAARRVDDSVERGETRPSTWRRRLRTLDGATLADRCVQALLHEPRIASGGLRSVLEQSLAGLELEAEFRRPRPRRAYRRLLARKSVPTMLFLDALLFADEDPDTRESHATAFAVSTQMGDDCRDAVRDLRAGRCFVTQEEAAGRPALAAARSRAFAVGRAESCRAYLRAAEASARNFRSRRSRASAERLSGLWRYAIDSGQIRPTNRRLRVQAGFPSALAARAKPTSPGST